MDVKNIKEVLEAVKLLGVSAKAVLKDGKVDLADLPVLVSLMNQADVIVKAVEGAGDIPAEIKDISADEAQDILGAVVETIRAIRAA